MQIVVLEKKGDSKAPYCEVNYKKGGCFTKVEKKVKGKEGVHLVALQHVSGELAKVVPPLQGHYEIFFNNKDWEAKLGAAGKVTEVPCFKVFEEAKKLDCLPKMLKDERVGQSYEITPKKSDKPILALTNGPRDQEDFDASASSSSRGGNGIRRASRLPPGSGAGVGPAQGPSLKRARAS